MRYGAAMSKRVIVVDIGNTSTSVGLYAGGRVTRRSHGATRGNGLEAVANRLLRASGGRPPDGVAVASVVPAATAFWRKAARRLWKAVDVLEIHHALDLGVGVDYPRPETIGADRLCNASAALARYGAPVIVADFGTAVTFDLVSPEGQYIGGVIAPGLPLMFDYLAEKTALLPRVEWGRVRHAAGKSTEEAIRLGAWWGYRGLVREILSELKARLGWRNVAVCATGGYAKRILSGSGIRSRVDPDLTLYGAARIYERNRR